MPIVKYGFFLHNFTHIHTSFLFYISEYPRSGFFGSCLNCDNSPFIILLIPWLSPHHLTSISHKIFEKTSFWSFCYLLTLTTPDYLQQKIQPLLRLMFKGLGTLATSNIFSLISVTSLASQILKCTEVASGLTLQHACHTALSFPLLCFLLMCFHSLPSILPICPSRTVWIPDTFAHFLSYHDMPSSLCAHVNPSLKASYNFYLIFKVFPNHPGIQSFVKGYHGAIRCQK